MERDIIKFIDGEIYYYYDYANFLYKELEKRDKALFVIRLILTTEYDKLTDDTYKKDVLNKVLEMIDTVMIGGNESEIQNEQHNL